MSTTGSAGLPVIVIGCGVSGLSCGIRLLEQGFNVIIYAKDLPLQTTSSVAPAIWDPGQLEGRELAWARTALVEFLQLATIPESGISLTQRIDFLDQANVDGFTAWWADVVTHFGLRPATYLPAHELPSGYAVGLQQEILLFDTSIYLPYLVAQFQQLGGLIEQRTVTDLAELYETNRLLINCSGLGARTLVNDEGVYPIRGQIVRIRPTPLKAVLRDLVGPRALTFMVQRAQDCVLGATYEPHTETMEIDLDIAATILRRCAEIEPMLTAVEIIEHRVGLRPGREHVRLEVEAVTPHCSIIHNYGHGSHGYSFSWGCAAEVTLLATQFAKSVNATYTDLVHPLV